MRTESASRLPPSSAAGERTRKKWLTERTSHVPFQRKVSRRYHGSHCDSRINFNAPPHPDDCVSLPLPPCLPFSVFLFFFFSGEFEYPSLPPHTLPNLARVTSSRSTCTWSCECVCPCGRGGGCGVWWKRKKKSA